MWRIDMVRKMHCLALALALSLAAGSVVTSSSAEAGFLLDAVKEGVKEGVKQGVTDGVKKVAAKGEEVAKKGALRTQYLRQRPRQTSFASR
jgi:hypothetical protein